MKTDVVSVRKCLKAFDFQTLFREHLGWDNHQAQLDVPVGGTSYRLTALAQKRGFVAFFCSSIPERTIRLKIDHQITKSVREHFVIYADEKEGVQVWQWVRREPGKPVASRDHRYDISQTGDALIQRLDQIAVSIDEEETITVVDVAGRARAAFDVDKVTKRFYDRFKTEHSAFMKLIKGITVDADLQWYTSLMLNRLMFVYFIQKKGFLDGDSNYLRKRLALVRQARGKDKFQSFYRYFLLRLFHEGLGKSPKERNLDAALEKLLGEVPYLNGGFFEVHQLEERNPEIDIPDKAFEKLFDFFDQYSWHLDERPLRADNEINPDVVGYIFEKYVNQKQMGAYYTKEDITEYISKNTIIPYLFDAAQKRCDIAFQPDSALWRLLHEDPDRYIYPAVRHGVVDEMGNVVPLPAEIEAGIQDVAKRDGWNKLAADGFGLPTETWREHVARRKRCLQIRENLRKGEIHQINDLITLNLDIWQFARDAIVNAEGPDLLRALWHAVETVTVLDPTCGSGAFLFAALRILETLYADCLERMERFVEEADSVAMVTPEEQVIKLIDSGESANTEFKSSCRWDLVQNKYNPAMEEVIIKAIAGFLNSYGGTLLIGIDDAGVVVGLENDYRHTDKKRPDRDRFELWFTQYLANKLEKAILPHVRVDFVTLDGKDVCRVIVYRAGAPVFVDKAGQEILYVRRGNATVPYKKASEIVKYKEQHWPADQLVSTPPPPASPYAIPSNQPNERGRTVFGDFRQTLAKIGDHLNGRYFILKSIIINNLFGVDIMQEAIEICKLRLFLKLVAQVELIDQIEPLPDIDFNIRAGNTLVGYATLDQVRRSQEGTLGFGKDQIKRIEEDAEMVDRAFRQFRAQQTSYGGKVTHEDKQELRRRMERLDAELDRYLATDYGISRNNYGSQTAYEQAFLKWQTNHQPFHWLVEFYGIIASGGFNVTIGNPPYLERSKLGGAYKPHGLKTEGCRDIYAWVTERMFALRNAGGRLGLIVPVSLASSGSFDVLRDIVHDHSRQLWLSHFANRPGQLFIGAQNRLTIILSYQSGGKEESFSTRYHRWDARNGERDALLSTMEYAPLGDLARCLKGLYPKVGSTKATAVLRKIQTPRTLSEWLEKRSKWPIYWIRVPGYFCQFFLDPPKARPEKGGSAKPRGELNTVYAPDEKRQRTIHAILNSSTYYQFFCAYTDVRHINPSDVTGFPVDTDRLDIRTTSSLVDLSRRLESAMRASTSERRKSGLLIESVDSRPLKPILDEIDIVLSGFYEFTSEEMDFITNYDIKYRVGPDADDVGNR